jgi:inhibitor of cysteine peptidase
MAVRSLAAVALLGTIAIAACSSTDAAEPAGATCDQFGLTASIEQSRTVDRGADLTVVLCSNPSTGFAWGDPQVSDGSLISVANRAFNAPAQGSGVVGAPGEEILTIHAAAVGTATLSISYDQPWDGGTKNAWTYQLTVTVR